MSKPLPKRIPSDDCAVTIDGTIYHPHEGEHVEMYAGLAVGELQAFAHMQQLGTQLLAVQGEEGEQEKIFALLEPHYEEVCQYLADRLVSWDWTDLKSRPLPPPDNPAVLKRLQPQELYWLLVAAQGETPAQRKNGSAPSPITSSVSGSTPTGARKSTSGHSHTKAS